MKKRSILIEFNWKDIEIETDDTISTLKSELLFNGRPNLLESNFKLSKIRFWIRDRLSLVPEVC